jgi:hypothetical protein
MRYVTKLENGEGVVRCRNRLNELMTSEGNNRTKNEFDRSP